MWIYAGIEYYLTVSGESWLASASDQPDLLGALWAARPWAPSVVPCGRTFDVIALPQDLGHQVLQELHTHGPGYGPVAVYRSTVELFSEVGTADRLNRLLSWQEWSQDVAGLQFLGAGDSVTIPPFRRRVGDPVAEPWIHGPDTRHPWLPDANALLRACRRATRPGPAAPAGTPDLQPMGSS
jgi:hypothetical protein